MVEIRIDFGDRNSAPVPEEAAMRAAMADQAMALYEDLSPRTPVHSVSVHYSHEAQDAIFQVLQCAFHIFHVS